MNLPNKALLIIGSIVGIVGVVIIILSSTTPSKPNKVTPPSFSSTPTPSMEPLSQTTQPQVKYNSQKNDQLLNSVINRQPLADSDAEVKQILIAKLNGKSGILQKTANYQLDYVVTPDLFQVEILNVDIDSAKKQAINWLMQHGFSRDGLCKLPLMFYLSQSVKNDLSSQKDVEFNPLPEGC